MPSYGNGFSFSDLVAYFGGKKPPKRYIVGATIHCGPKVKIPELNVTIKAIPPNSKIPVYNSYKEAIAEKSFGKQEYIDIKKTPSLKVTLPTEVTTALMEFDGNPHHYTAGNSFGVETIIKGQRKIFRYYPSQMGMTLKYSTDKKTFDKMKAAADLEDAYNRFSEQAKYNGTYLAALAKSKSDFSAAQLTKLQAAIVDHNYLLNTTVAKMPEGFKATKLKGKTALSGIGIIGIDDVLIIGAVYCIYLLVKAASTYITTKNDVDLATAAMADKQKLNEKILDIQNNPNLTQTEKDRQEAPLIEQQKAEQKNIDDITKTTNTVTSSGDIFDKTQNLLMWGGVIFLAVKIVPSLFNKKG